MSLDARITVQSSVTETPASALGQGRTQYIVEFAKSLLEGTGRHTIGKYGTKRVSAATGLTTYDLTAFVADQGTISFAKIRMLLVVSKTDTSGQDIKVGGNAAEPAGIFAVIGDEVWVYGGGFAMLYWPDGLTVTDATGDKLDVDAGVDTVDYDIGIWGE